MAGFLLVCVAAFLITGGLAVMLAGKPWGSAACYGLCALICAVAMACAVTSLQAVPCDIILPLGLPWIGMHIHVDALSAVFLCIVNLGGFSASLFGIGYGHHERVPERVLPFFPAFLAGMNLVLLAGDAFSFLIFWEFMSLTSWALVVSHSTVPGNLRAGLIYLIMAGIGTMLLMMAFALLAGPEGHFSFAAMRGHMQGAAAAWVVVLALIGAGSKAGLFPLHAWLPLAHPAAPSHVSALMSGVMTKVAIYAFIRIAFDLVGPVDWRLGMVVIAIGAATAFLGGLYALLQNDLKRLLAYSTVENVGIIFTALGLSLCFRANGLGAAAALALTAALFHAFNHALFKSLLFFGAGVVQAATGTRDMDKLGGLIHRMPKTAMAVLAGAMAIAAIPPMNGFASEWMVFQSIFLSPEFPQWGLRLIAPAAGAILALAAALAAATFVKAFGISFLGRARSAAAKDARETDPVSIAAMALLAVLCLVTGLVPSLILAHLHNAVQMLTTATVPATHFWQPLLPAPGHPNGYGGLMIFISLAAAVAATVLFLRYFSNRTIRRSAIWDCGHPEDIVQSQYSASSFSQPLRRVFASVLFGAHEEVMMPPPGDISPAQHKLTLHDPAW
ncbi:MAG: hydrogenase 4 subunit B, partial [Rhizomicrobium sp.]